MQQVNGKNVTSKKHNTLFNQNKFSIDTQTVKESGTDEKSTAVIDTESENEQTEVIEAKQEQEQEPKVEDKVEDKVEKSSNKFITSETITQNKQSCNCTYLDKDTGLTWTPHKYNIGDKVWVPQDEVIDISQPFTTINAQLKKIPKQYTVATVVYTNKVSYTFKESMKLVVAEAFIFNNKKECENFCKEF